LDGFFPIAQQNSAKTGGDCQERGGNDVRREAQTRLESLGGRTSSIAGWECRRVPHAFITPWRGIRERAERDKRAAQRMNKRAQIFFECGDAENAGAVRGTEM